MGNKPTNNQAGILKALGAEYSIVPVDLEPCVYRSSITGRSDNGTTPTLRHGSLSCRRAFEFRYVKTEPCAQCITLQRRCAGRFLSVLSFFAL
jgi:hypothetical protein